ncbi:MAG: patatin-like phospholipase family protein, partial [Bacteroidota bacterium]
SQALVRIGGSSSVLATVQEGYSFTDRKSIQGSIEDDLAELANQLILNSDRSLVKYQVAQEDILRAKTKAKQYQTAGVLTIGSGVVGGSGIGVGAVTSVLANAEAIQAGLTGLSLAGPIAGIGIGVVAIGSGVWCGNSLWQKGQDLSKEPVMREKLNEIMQEALAHYDLGKPQKFLEALAKEYGEGGRLLELEDFRHGVPAEKIMNTLTAHGFRPDGIAYLFNLMGEAFMSGKVSIPGCDSAKLTGRADDSFMGSLRKELVESAQILDTRITEMRKKGIGNDLKRHWNEATDHLFLRDKGYLARKHVTDAQEMPFTARLEEMRNVAKLNIAIMRIVRGNEKEINAAQTLVKEVRDTIDQYGHFHTMPAMRLAAIEDFLWVISGQTAAGMEAALQPSSVETPILAIEPPEDHYLAYLGERLERASSSQERAKIYNQRAAHYATKAQEVAKVDHLGSLQHWQVAQKNYASALHFIKHNETAALGYAQCLAGLSQYSQSLRYLQQHPGLKETPDFWVMASMAHRKQCHYQEAKECILEALQLAPQSQEAARQKALIESLQATTIAERLSGYRSTQLQCEELLFDARRSNEKQYYTILSLDGGGVRGVLPALWLSEIESRTKRPIAHLFNMLAGTSTGAIIAAGLSVPQIDVPEVRGVGGEVEQEEVLSPYRPRYSASDIVQLYREQSPAIFTSLVAQVPLVASLYSFVGSRYSDQGRLSVFRQYFGQATLRQALTELVIPAVNKDVQHRSHLFSRHESRRDPANDETFYNALMATTAAPTFFPPYKIPGKGVFFDGVISAGNPAANACSAAQQYGIPQEKIFMLSMGAGTCIPDPENPDLHCGQLFWASSFHRVSLALQEGDSDGHMRSGLKNCYQRWQVWLERPIGIDAYQEMDTLLELGQQHLEELYASDENTMNKLLEFLEENPAP